MSTAEIIQDLVDDEEELDTDIGNAYDEVQTKGGTVPQNKNTNNLAPAIRTIPTGITPTGTVSITQNGTYDVTNYASASVAVQALIDGFPYASGNFTPEADMNTTNSRVTITHENIGDTQFILLWVSNPNIADYTYSAGGYMFSGAWIKTEDYSGNSTGRFCFYRNDFYMSGTNSVIENVTSTGFRVKGASYGVLKAGVTYHWLAIGTVASE